MAWQEQSLESDFFAKLQELTLQAHCGRDYVLTSALIEWLGSPFDDSSPSRSRADRLWRLAYDARFPGFFLPLLNLVEDSQELYLVLSALLSISAGHLTERFRDKGIYDSKLPVKLEELAFLKENDKDLPRKFYKQQFRFCAAKFSDTGWENNHADYVVPICRRKLITKGGTASLWQISVQEEFVSQHLRTLASRMNYTDKDYGKVLIVYIPFSWD